MSVTLYTLCALSLCGCSNALGTARIPRALQEITVSADGEPLRTVRMPTFPDGAGALQEQVVQANGEITKVETTMPVASYEQANEQDEEDADQHDKDESQLDDEPQCKAFCAGNLAKNRNRKKVCGFRKCNGCGFCRRLRIDGNKIYDNDDHEWIGKGMNWGRHSNLQLYNATDAAQMKKLLHPWVNHIRVVFKWHARRDLSYDAYDANEPEHGYLKQSLRDYIDNIVKWATSESIWVTLTMTYNGGIWHKEDKYAGEACTPFVTDPTWKREHQNMMQYLVKKYYNTPYIAFMEPWSEAKMGGCTEEQAAEWMNDLVAAIHEVDADMPVALTEHYNQCHGPPHWKKLTSDKIIYPINFWCPSATEESGYGIEQKCKTAWGKGTWGRECFDGCKEDRDALTTPSQGVYRKLIEGAFATAAKKGINAPMWADQWGCNYDRHGSYAWIADMAKLYKEYGISSAWWSYKGPCKMCVVGPEVDCENPGDLAAGGYASKNDCKTDLTRMVPKESMVKAMNAAMSDW